MSYLEKKKIKGKIYYYLTTTKRVGKQFKKTRKYLGTHPPPKSRLPKPKPLPKGLLTASEKKAIDLIKGHYADQHHPARSLWSEERERLVSFIYNTNAIEGNTFTLEETDSVLKGHPAPARHERDAREVLNMKECIDFLLSYDGPLDESLILRLHGIEQAGLLPDAGRYRQVNVRVGSYICPPHAQVPALMQKFLSWYSSVKPSLHPFELSAQVHLRFVRIHPFRDGNGRMARLLANLVLWQAGYPLLNIFNDQKVLYYLVLQRYDIDGKFRPVVRYFAEVFINQYKEYWK